MSDFDAENESVETSAPIALVDSANIEPLIHTVRGQQVMLDTDLARLYEVETKNLNRAAARNTDRFPEDFRFQLTKEEDESLRCQIGTSKTVEGRGGRRYLPYAYTEQGIAMLSGVLRSEAAVQTSISIMRAFVAMRHFLAENAALLERLRGIESSQAAFQQSTDERFDQVFRLLEGEIEKPQRIFFAGQMFDAFSLLTDLVSRAKREIVLVDGYVDVRTLNILAKKREGVAVAVYTSGNRLTQDDVDVFNAQYPPLTVLRTRAFHDRFLILDGETAYHIGASLKDAGKKCFGIDLIQDEGLTKMFIEKLRVLDEQSAT
ncbi:MAG TPA: ORF6N domain-containing protein [Collinsella ihuae]|uniref:ORF6N domain-containing protein n=1 Tax=Collinsella ihumii TaxID=1720204 RepID=A0A921IMP1_9ACTN|nr:ORF6N domain-containing protein [Collinsella ihumii]